MRHPHWTGGTQLLAVLIERLGGQPVTISQADVEAAAFGTTNTVRFTMSDDGTSVTLAVERPEPAETSDKSGIPLG